MPHAVLNLFHPVIREWFNNKYSAPTDAQIQAWPAIEKGGHVFASAPTGSGKTLTAFLYAIDSLVTGRWETGALRVLYISPLKALNNDIQRNLLTPLAEIQTLFEKEGKTFPSIRVLTRSGDTPNDERRRIITKPPEILITTPESLNLMLTSKSGRSVLTHIQAVILDEVHAVAGTKRGTYLITAIERLTRLSGEFQRIGLSATAKPLETIAAWMAGYRNISGEVYEKRPIEVIQSRDKREIELTVEMAEPIQDTNDGKPPDPDIVWDNLAKRLRKIIDQNHSTLLFVNSRRMAEKIARFINEGQETPVAYSHHGSLSRELRYSVEEKMKAGELKAIVATGSLELGIDIGSINQVVLVQTPPSAAQAFQRIGRADHHVGGTSHASLYPLHGIDAISAAVLSGMIQAGEIEEIIPVKNPLDVLAQIILSMTLREEWPVDDLYLFLKTMSPFHALPRKYFDLTLSMLSGRYADSPVKELKPRITIDHLKGTVKAREGMDFLIYQSGGTIPDHGYFHLRTADTKALIGELDEEFVWERSLGDLFVLGNQTWRITAITHNDVEVIPAGNFAAMNPFWKADDQNRDFFTSEKIGLFLEEADKLAGTKEFTALLQSRYHLDFTSAQRLSDFLLSQKDHTKKSLPGRYHIVMESVKEKGAPMEIQQVVMHTFWGGRVNRPFALALSQAWEDQNGAALEFYCSNDNILFILPDAFEPETILRLVTPENLEKLLRLKLEKTSLFGARFRENAGRALLLPKGDMKNRYPLWMNRLRSKKLLDAVKRYTDFPIILETWRECLDEEFDLASLRLLLEEIDSGKITVSACKTGEPSPFSDGVVWRQTNYYMYVDDAPASAKNSLLSDELYRELLQDASIRPKIPQKMAVELEGKLQRTADGYAPESTGELLDWLHDSVMITAVQFEKFLKTIHEPDTSQLTKDFASAVNFKFPGAEIEWITLAHELPRLLSLRNISLKQLSLIKPALSNLPEEEWNQLTDWIKNHPYQNDTKTASFLLLEFLRYRGPVSSKEIQSAFGWTEEETTLLISELTEQEQVITGPLMAHGEEFYICETDNCERLLRMLRAVNRPVFEAIPSSYLPLYLADRQGLVNTSGNMENLQKTLDRLFGYPLSAEVWEEAVLPCRLSPYYPSWLDSLFQSYNLNWFGCGNEKLSFSFPEDLELFLETPLKADAFFPGNAKTGLFELAKHNSLKSADTAETLWKLAWKGKAASDNYETVRKGILSGFKPSVTPEATTSRRSGFNRWEASRPLTGNWFPLELEEEDDLLNRAEIEKDRVRLLFKRYGVIFKQVLLHENPFLKWPKVFRTLRLLELSGEIVSGQFFKGIPGIQFASHEAFRELQNRLPEDSIWFINAVDPASLCGSGLEDFQGLFPKRTVSSWIVFKGCDIVLVLNKDGRDLNIRVLPGNGVLTEALKIYAFFLTREFNPRNSLTVETINGIPAPESGFTEDLKKAGFTREYKGFTIWKRY